MTAGKEPVTRPVGAVAEHLRFVERHDHEGRPVGREPVVTLSAQFVDRYGRLVPGGASAVRGVIVLYGRDGHALKSINVSTHRRAQ